MSENIGALPAVEHVYWRCLYCGVEGVIEHNNYRAAPSVTGEVIDDHSARVPHCRSADSIRIVLDGEIKRLWDCSTYEMEIRLEREKKRRQGEGEESIE